MRLYTSPASPYARKCRVLRLEKGLEDRIEEVTAVFPYKDEAFLKVNPIGQVPALVMDDGVVMTDSPLICAWMDQAGQGVSFLPASGPDHWRVRRLEVMADAVMEATVKQIMEGRRPEGERSATWTAYWHEGMNLALDRAEQALGEGYEGLDLGTMSVAIAGLYLDFRMPELDWREARPRLAVLCDAMDVRASFAATRPVIV